jgi:hypothetical protein
MAENNDENNVEIFGGDDFIYTVTTGGNGKPTVMAGGYQVGSYFLEQGESPIATLNKQDGGKENVSSPFEYLAVPVGLFYINAQHNKSEKDIKYQKHNTIEDDLYDKLFALIQENKNKKNKKTRKHRDDTESKSKSKKKTRRNI